MKKLLAIVLALVLCVSALSVVAFAAPDGLNSLAIVGTGIPGVGEWNPADPAGDMDEVSESVFVTEVACPAGTSFSFKVAGNDAWDDAFNFGSANIVFGQTADLENGGGSKDMPVSVDHDCTLKITVDLNALSEGGAATILVEEIHDGAAIPPSTDKPSTPSAPENGDFTAPSSLAIVGTGIPGVGEWNPADPAGDMTEVSELVYEISIPCNAGTAMTFKFAGNDAWDDTCNLGSATVAIGATADLVNGSSATDMSLTVDKDVVLKFTVDLTALADGTGAATITIAEVDGEVPPADPGTDAPAEGNVKVHARIPASWGETPCFWAWEASSQKNAFASWPGEPMTKNGEWFEIEIPNWVDSVIVNDGQPDTSTKTADLSVEAGKELWIDVYSFDEVTVSYADPGARVEPTEPETEPTTKPTTAPTTEPATEDEGSKTDMKAAKRNHAILVVVLILIWVVVVAEVISIFLKKKI